jgi:F-type H+-transporting ATPase subunit a
MIKNKFTLFVIAILIFCNNIIASTHSNDSTPKEQFNLKEMIFSHVLDDYEWHLFTLNKHHISIPLPVIVRSSERGWFLFSSARLQHGDSYNGFYRATSERYHNKVVEINSKGEEVRPFDISFTKNAASIILTCILLIAIFLTVAHGYKRQPLRSRRGFIGSLEMLIVSLHDDLIKPCVGKDYKRFAPYLLTAFFFIFVNNLLGLVPLFPGGANVTGNIAVTMVLALLTFIITNIFGPREYWKEIFWPDVPLWLKVPLPVMPFVEFLGVLTKPFALMIRLFANILAGHIIILVLTGLIFIFSIMISPVVGGAVSVVSVLFSIFMLLIDVLVSFIQAYVFTMLSAIFIGMARIRHAH